MLKIFKNKKAQSILEYSLIFILVSIPIGMVFLNLRTAITTKSINTMEHISTYDDQYFSKPR